MPKEKLDFWLIGTITFLVFFGLLAIYDASVVSAYRDFGDKLYYFKNQLIWAVFGFGALGFFSFFDYKRLLKFSSIILIIAILLLIVVLLPIVSTEIYGARRWINLGFLTFQPSEFAKLALIFYSTEMISKFEKYKIRLIDTGIVFFLPLILITSLVLIQPDLGTALIYIGIMMTIYFIGQAPLWHFFTALPLLIVSVIIFIVKEPYRLTRIKSYLDPLHDPQGASYQINQILVAISSAGLLGVGIGASRSKFAYIPEVQSDAIFAIIVEELGFVGAIFVVSLFLFLITKSIQIALNSRDFQGRVLAMGIVALISFQVILNLGSAVALVPLTGIPLPFVSYGGSSLFVTMSAMGILININKHS
ncbi:cell division protein FtsW [Candidatus Curtissbacteria bacterium RIFCSPHIGHO2_12_FULL_38_9b]|uniref:Probable peptidoglycan glycosyltransferase FtsW n=2 Tax=Candidatus Curtissiibacteriota TaxID=1752717 RepID=A0A1F5GU69_9BACT|nr:MAG: cell division protein FtsW [Candidatus Curtissbacteria bacterium RIFCSPLOWO2_01_FULL_37_9]OGD95436.1 MAG: cell division protein FtsW [Candidatus Curtissbacteria bacterium RIFCSPHIGHO2_12_FULL_38_9b]